MIDKLFGTIEDIYFTIVSDTLSENQTVLTIDKETSNLQETLTLFKEQALQTMYIGKPGDKYQLLKLAVSIFNYIMHEDDGIFSKHEQAYLSEYIGKKFTRFTTVEQQDLQETMQKRVTLEDIIELVDTSLLTLRPIDMILDKIALYVQDNPKYHAPLCTVLHELMKEKRES